MDFRAGNPKLHAVKGDYHRHGLHKCPLQATLRASITRHVIICAWLKIYKQNIIFLHFI